MWENQPRGGTVGSSGVSGEKDLLDNLLPLLDDQLLPPAQLPED